MEMTINETSIAVPDQCATWGDLLDWLEMDYLKAGQCITRIAVDGQEELDYRKQDMMVRNLMLLGTVHVECGEFDKVVRESLSELQVEIDHLMRAVSQITDLLDNRDEEAAYRTMAELLENIRILFGIMAEDLGWTDPADAEIKHQDIPARLESALIQLISAQERRFSLLICDILEYEISPILEQWKKIVEATLQKLAI